MCKCENLLVKRVKRGRGRLKSIWKEIIVRDLYALNIKIDLVHKKFEYKHKIHINKNFKNLY